MYTHAQLTLTELNALKQELEAEIAFCRQNSPVDAVAVEQELDSLNDELLHRQQLVSHMLVVTAS